MIPPNDPSSDAEHAPALTANQAVPSHTGLAAIFHRSGAAEGAPVVRSANFTAVRDRSTMPTVQYRLMSTLLYPSLLGAGLVWFFQSFSGAVASGPTDELLLLDFLGIRLALALLVLAYFFAPYLLLLIEDQENYRWTAFLADLGDVFVIFVLFYMLGIVVNTFRAPLGIVYLSLTLIPLVGVLGNLLATRPVRWRLSAATATVTVFMGVIGHRWAWLNLTILVTLAILLGLYFRVVARALVEHANRQRPSSAKSPAPTNFSEVSQYGTKISETGPAPRPRHKRRQEAARKSRRKRRKKH